MKTVRANESHGPLKRIVKDDQSTPWATMASATFTKPAALAPSITKSPSWPYSLAACQGHCATMFSMMRLELVVHLFERPGKALGVLAHLKAGHRHAARVGRLSRARTATAVVLDSTAIASGVDGMLAPSHTDLAAVGDEGLGGLLDAEFVLAWRTAARCRTGRSTRRWPALVVCRRPERASAYSLDACRASDRRLMLLDDVETVRCRPGS